MQRALCLYSSSSTAAYGSQATLKITSALFAISSLGSNTIAVFPEYTPIPDAVFPTQIEECYAALKWTAAHGHDIGADGSRIVIAGNSVGGDMTAVLTLLAKERGGPALKAQVLFWPATDASVDSQPPIMSTPLAAFSAVTS
jgi:acetyl esterase/lipase